MSYTPLSNSQNTVNIEKIEGTRSSQVALDVSEIVEGMSEINRTINKVVNELAISIQNQKTRISEQNKSNLINNNEFIVPAEAIKVEVGTPNISLPSTYFLFPIIYSVVSSIIIFALIFKDEILAWVR